MRVDSSALFCFWGRKEVDAVPLPSPPIWVLPRGKATRGKEGPVFFSTRGVIFRPVTLRIWRNHKIYTPKGYETWENNEKSEIGKTGTGEIVRSQIQA